MSSYTTTWLSFLSMNLHCTRIGPMCTLIRLRKHVPLLSYVLVWFLRLATPRRVQPSQNPDSYWRNIAQFPFTLAKPFVRSRTLVHTQSHSYQYVYIHVHHLCTHVIKTITIQALFCTCTFLQRKVVRLLTRCQNILYE